MRTIYRLTFPNGNGFTENDNLQVLKTVQQTQGGVITAYDFECYVMRGDTIVSGPYDQADDAETDLNNARTAAVQELMGYFSTTGFKTLADPQPEGLND